MELWKLITAGRIEKSITVDGVEIILATPGMEQISGEDPYINLAQFVIKIGDQDYSTPEKKKELVEALKKMQMATFTKIATICGEMNKEQSALVEGLVSKKS